MELSLNFRLRHIQKQDQCLRPLLIRLRMDGEVAKSDYSSGIMIRPGKWSQENQMVTGRTKSADEINERIAQIELQHRDILREMKRRYARGEGPRPTVELVKAEFLNPGVNSPKLNAWYKTYLDYLDSLHTTEDGRAEKTIARAYKTLDHLRDFVSPVEAARPRYVRPRTIAEQNEIDNRSPLLTDITVGWGKRFHVWLQTHPASGVRRMTKDSANKYLSHVRDAINYAVDEGFLPNNPLDKFRPKRGKGKPVYFLEATHVEKLMSLHFHDEQLTYVLWWVRLMCYTGLDYVDAIRYARQPESFEQTTKAGTKIVMAPLQAAPQHLRDTQATPGGSAFELVPNGPTRSGTGGYKPAPKSTPIRDWF